MTRFYAIPLCLLLAVAPASAHSDHDHGAAPASATPIAPRLQSAGSDLELVAAPNGHTLTIYLDRLTTNAPVDGATIEVSGDGIPTAVAKEVGNGTYEVDAEWADEPGAKALVFTISSDGEFELLNGVLDIHDPPEAATDNASTWLAALASPAAWILAVIAAMLGFFLSFAFRPLKLPTDETSTTEKKHNDAKPIACIALAVGLLAASFPDGASAHSDDMHTEGSTGASPAGTSAPRRLPDGDVFVPKPTQRLLQIRTAVAEESDAKAGRELIGTVVPDPSSFGQVQAPMDGRIELSARGISYAGQHVKAGEVLALLSPTIPIADLGTMQQLRAEVDGKLKIAEQRLSRLTRIAGVIAQKDIDDTKAELEALREQQRVLEPKGIEKIPLKAPVSGVISIANVRAGQVVNARDTLFEIVDPDRLWIEAVGATGHATAADIASAHATDADGHSIDLSYVGRAPALRQQALPMQFRVEETHDGLIIGSAVKVIVEQGPALRGIVLPTSAVVRGNSGLPQVWTKVSAEQFKPETVVTAPLDGAHVLVTSGIADGARVVVQGAELINQIR